MGLEAALKRGGKGKGWTRTAVSSSKESSAIYTPPLSPPSEWVRGRAEWWGLRALGLHCYTLLALWA